MKKSIFLGLLGPGIIKTRNFVILGVVVVGNPLPGNTQRTQRKTYKVRLKKKRSRTTCIRIRREENGKRRDEGRARSSFLK